MAGKETKAQFFSVSDIGLTRSSNQDYFGNRGESNLFVVADGMGGHAGGERASRLAVETIFGSKAIEESGKLDIEAVCQRLREAIQAASRVIHEEALESYERKQMGTTIAALALHRAQALIAHVGDSRAYRLRGGALEQLTTDHSLVQDQLDAGMISLEQSKNHKLKNVITRALGIAEAVTVDMNVISIRKGDLFLLCTDGLHGLVSNDEIAEILNTQQDLGQCSQSLVALANARGGLDNITVTLVKVLEAPGKSISPPLKITGAAIGGLAAVSLALYLLVLNAPSTRDQKAATQPVTSNIDIPPVSEHSALPERQSGEDARQTILHLRNELQRENLTLPARIEKLMALASAEVEAGNPERARPIVSEIVSLYVESNHEFQILDIQDATLKEMFTEALDTLWRERSESARKMIADLQDTEAAPGREVQAALSLFSSAEEAFRSGRYFSALNEMEQSKNIVEHALVTAQDRKLSDKLEAQRHLDLARRELQEINALDMETLPALGVKLADEHARLREAQKFLESGDYKKSLKLSGMVSDNSKKLSASALRAQQAAQAVKDEANAMFSKVTEKWNYVSSGRIPDTAASLEVSAAAELAGVYQKFEGMMASGKYQEACAQGKKFLADADALTQRTAEALEKKLNVSENSLLEKMNSDKMIYDKDGLRQAETALGQARTFLKERSYSSAYEKADESQRLVDGLKGKARLSEPELDRLSLALEHANDLETYLKRSLVYFQESKQTAARQFVEEYSRQKFDSLFPLISPEHSSMRRLLEEARALCLGQERAVNPADVENALKKVKLLKQELDQTITENAPGR